MAKIDETGELITIADDGLVKLHGITILRRVLRGDKCYLQFFDSNKIRSQARRSPFVEIPVDVFVQVIQGKSIGASRSE